ncbi:MAG: hypothetical protein NTV62_02100 [Candidatus Gribaldobacteria bacterium]|nr:hypothetical protein [Candidatus Gribaldobacteria bacterium]
MKILIFVEGTILMHKNALGLSREKIIKQVQNNVDPSLRDYNSYIPIRNAVAKIKLWENQGAKIFYLTSRKTSKEISDIKEVLLQYDFPTGQLLARENNEKYKDVAERIIPNILIEDSCESIGGVKEMTITFIKPEIKQKIKSIVVKEFGGIDNLPDKINKL